MDTTSLNRDGKRGNVFRRAKIYVHTKKTQKSTFLDFGFIPFVFLSVWWGRSRPSVSLAAPVFPKLATRLELRSHLAHANLGSRTGLSRRSYRRRRLRPLRGQPRVSILTQKKLSEIAFVQTVGPTGFAGRPSGFGQQFTKKKRPLRGFWVSIFASF